jgi:hypothetical protein
LCTLICTFLGTRREGRRCWREWMETFSKFNLLLIQS